MCHVQKSARGISLYAHVAGLGQPRKWTKSTRPGNLRLILFVGSEVGYASHGIALDFDVWRQHLTDQGRQTAKLDNEDLVFRYRAASAPETVIRHCARLTVDGKVP